MTTKTKEELEKELDEALMYIRVLESILQGLGYTNGEENE